MKVWRGHSGPRPAILSCLFAVVRSPRGFREPRFFIAMKPTRVPVTAFVEKLRTYPASAFDHTETIRTFLQEMPVEEASLAPYLTWDRKHYTRNLIDKSDLYELLAICWEIGQTSSVHNHRDQMCWMAAPIGCLVVENFHVRFQDIEAGKCRLDASNRVELTPENPCAVDPREPVRRVVNPRTTNQRAVTLHVYSRPFDTCVVYSLEQGTCGDIRLHYNTMYGKAVPSSQCSGSEHFRSRDTDH